MDAPRLLLVDDHLDTCRVLSLLLELSGYQVGLAGDAAEALELAARERYDLYILDVQLPDCDGLQLCRELRERTPNVPVIFYSALGDRQLQQRALECGGSLYLVKPVTVDVLESALRSFVPARVAR